MNENHSLWGYVLTDYELIIVRRTTEYGRIRVSQSIPLSAAPGQLNAKIALWWLHYGVSFHEPKHENDKGGFLPMSPLPDEFRDFVDVVRKSRTERRYSVVQGVDGYDILEIVPPIRRLSVATNESVQNEQSVNSFTVLKKKQETLEPLLTRKRPHDESGLDERYFEDSFDSVMSREPPVIAKITREKVPGTMRRL